MNPLDDNGSPFFGINPADLGPLTPEEERFANTALRIAAWACTAVIAIGGFSVLVGWIA